MTVGLKCPIPAKHGCKKLRNHCDNILCNDVFLQDRLSEAYFGTEGIWKGSLDDAVNGKHNHANAAIWEEDDPEKLVEQAEVWFSLQNKTSLWKPNEDCSEHDIEERRVVEENVDGKVEKEPIFAAKLWIDSVGREEEEAEAMQGSQDTLNSKSGACVWQETHHWQ